MTSIDRHLLRHARLDGVSALVAYIGAFVLLTVAIRSGSVAALVVLTPLSALVMFGSFALVLELIRLAGAISERR